MMEACDARGRFAPQRNPGAGPGGGLIHFAGQRALLLDAVAMGILRQYLVANFGFTAARAVLTQLGFARGWRTAEALKKNVDQ